MSLFSRPLRPAHLFLSWLLLGCGLATSACADPVPAAEVTATTGNPVLTLTTNKGTIELELFPKQAPATVKHILSLVDAEFYDGLTFHRGAANFVIQAGGYTADMTYREPPGTVVNESANGLGNLKGTVAMARLNDPDSADAQFFINVNDNHSLDAKPGVPGYTVFGKVISDWSVVVDIELVDTGPSGHMISVPVEPIVISSVRRTR